MGFDENDIVHLVQQYEAAFHTGKLPYFDVEDLETILEYYLDTGSYSEMRRGLQYALDLHPKSMALKIKEVQLDIATRDYSRAEARLTYLESLNVNNAELSIARATILMQRGEMTLGLKMLDQALELAEDKVEVLHLIIDAHLNQGNYGKAIDALLMTIDEQKDEPLDEATIYQLAMSLDFTNAFERGIEVFTGLTQNEPYNALLWYQIGAFQLRMNKEKKALEAFEWAVLAEDDFHAAHFEIGRIHERNERLIDALASYRQSVSDDVPSGYIHFRIAMIEQELGSLNEALREFNLAIDLEPDMDDVYLERAGLLSELERFKEAALDFERVWLEEAYGEDDVLDFVECLIELDNLDRAVEVLYEAVNRFPENHIIKLVLAGYLFALDDYTAGEAIMIEAFKQEPTALVLFKEYFPGFNEISAVSNILARLSKNLE